MSVQIILIFLFCLTWNIKIADSGVCPYGWLSSPGTGQCLLYMGVIPNFFWPEASAYCQQLGATLPMLKSAAEKSSYNLLMGQSFNVSTVDIHYLGLYNYAGTWLWADNSSLGAYNAWDTASGNPSGDGLCAYMYVSNSNTWNDYNCQQAVHPFACQMPESACPFGWVVSSTGMCYLCQNGTANLFWQNASSYCQSLGANLPILASSTEMTAYNTLMSGTVGITSTFIQYLGLYLNGATWTWVDNSAVGYTFWDADNGNPSGDGSCTYMTGWSNANMWNDYDCSYPYPLPFCCQMNGSSGACPSGWLSAMNGQCYLKVMNSMNYFWKDAQTYCQGMGAQLPVFHNLDESISFNNLLAVMNVTSGFYLGLAMNAVGGPWTWVDNSALNYQNWATGEPNGDGLCVCTNGLHANNTWYDDGCNSCFGSIFFCQLSPSGLITSTATTTLETTSWSTTLPVATTTIYSPYVCPSGWLASTTGQCYFYYDNQASFFLWNDALTYCRAKNATLPIFQSLEEQYAYNTLISSINIPYSASLLGLYFNIDSLPPTWMWADNSSTTFFYWGSGSPSGDGYCTGMSGTASNNTWNDYACTWDTNPLAFFCQITATMQVPPVLVDMNIPMDFLDDPVSLTTTLQDVGPFLIASLNASMKQQLGQQYADLVRICTYENKDCSDKTNFQYLYNPTYGNCFTFNFGIIPKYSVKNIGPNYGLRLLLHASQEDYSCSSQNAGFRITFHENSLPIYPESEGYNIPPGTSSAITLQQSTITRLGKPFDVCVDSADKDYGGNYTVEDCLRKCFQRYLIQQCKCADPRYPIISNDTICTAKKKNCLDHSSFCLFDEAMEQCNCPPPCKEIIYFPTTTSVTLQSTDIYKNSFCRTAANISLCEISFSENFAILYVYYESLKSFEYNEKATYQIMNLLSDFSGVTGLLLGVCVMTVPEIALFMFYILTICCTKRK